MQKKSAAPAAVPAAPASEALAKQLTSLARALRDNGTPANYAALAAFATRNEKNEFGARAALALGYYDMTPPHQKPEEALRWLRKSAGDNLLREYVLYWQAENSLALGQKEEAFEQFQSFLRDFPDSVMAESATEDFVPVALQLGKDDAALAALAADPNTAAKSSLLLLRAEAHEKTAAAKGEKAVAAAQDYLDLYYRFPLNDEAASAGHKIPQLESALGESFPGTPVQTQIARAETFFLAKRWSEARAEYTGLLPKLSGRDHERAELRIAVCAVQLGANSEALNKVALTDPDLQAERLFAVSQAHRNDKLEPEMLADIEALSKSFPNTAWAADGLYATGNYFWVNMERQRAAEYYRLSSSSDPNGKNAPSAEWRIAWTAYLDRKPEAVDMLEAYIRRRPSSPYIQDALYWLGRAYERWGNLERARGFYLADVQRFPLTYFGERAAERVRPEPAGIGPAPFVVAEVVAAIPPAPSLPAMSVPQTEKIEGHEARALALSQIAFDASAELEYRAVYAATHSPKFLVEAAKAAAAAGQYSAAMAAVRQVFPQLEARRLPDLPADAWRAAFPLPYETRMRSEAQRNHIDPMLVAGLIRQESAFAPAAMSHVGAMGLMQVMPTTALKLARQMKVRYARARLTDPGYNLQLGSRYLANLIQDFGSPEAALAAYNAGEDRVAQWTAGQNYLESAEFVESIPFTETREYVQNVIRNAEVYRQVYGAVPAATEETKRSEAAAGKHSSGRPAAHRAKAGAGHSSRTEAKADAPAKSQEPASDAIAVQR